MVQDLENDRTVMQQTVRKIDGLLTAIKGRMSDKVMEYYAADYGHPWYQIIQSDSGLGGGCRTKSEPDSTQQLINTMRYFLLCSSYRKFNEVGTPRLFCSMSLLALIRQCRRPADRW